MKYLVGAKLCKITDICKFMNWNFATYDQIFSIFNYPKLHICKKMSTFAYRISRKW